MFSPTNFRMSPHYNYLAKGDSLSAISLLSVINICCIFLAETVKFLFFYAKTVCLLTNSLNAFLLDLLVSMNKIYAPINVSSVGCLGGGRDGSDIHVYGNTKLQKIILFNNLYNLEEKKVLTQKQVICLRWIY